MQLPLSPAQLLLEPTQLLLEPTLLLLEPTLLPSKPAQLRLNRVQHTILVISDWVHEEVGLVSQVVADLTITILLGKLFADLILALRLGRLMSQSLAQKDRNPWEA